MVWGPVVWILGIPLKGLLVRGTQIRIPKHQAPNHQAPNHHFSRPSPDHPIGVLIYLPSHLPHDWVAILDLGKWSLHSAHLRRPPSCYKPPCSAWDAYSPFENNRCLNPLSDGEGFQPSMLDGGMGIHPPFRTLVALTLKIQNLYFETFNCWLQFVVVENIHPVWRSVEYHMAVSFTNLQLLWLKCILGSQIYSVFCSPIDRIRVELLNYLHLGRTKR